MRLIDFILFCVFVGACVGCILTGTITEGWKTGVMYTSGLLFGVSSVVPLKWFIKGTK